MTCTEDGCTKPLRAKGMCVTHYNQQRQPNRHRKVAMTCDGCGEPCMKEVNNTRNSRFCDLACRDLYAIDNEDYATRGRKQSATKTAKALANPKQAPIPQCAVAYTNCGVCGAIICHKPGRRGYCSTRCRNRAHDSQRGKRHKIRRVLIFERDGYVCWICEQPCDPMLRVPHSLAATVDHLVPQSLGGTHESDNLATAHMRCNSIRGASWGWPDAS